MKSVIEDLYKKTAVYQEKYNDPELNELLLNLVQKFQDADAMYHHFGYLLMHIKATVAHPVRPTHLQGAIDRAQRFLNNYAGGEK